MDNMFGRKQPQAIQGEQGASSAVDRSFFFLQNITRDSTLLLFSLFFLFLFSLFTVPFGAFESGSTTPQAQSLGGFGAVAAVPQFVAHEPEFGDFVDASAFGTPMTTTMGKETKFTGFVDATTPSATASPFGGFVGVSAAPNNHGFGGFQAPLSAPLPATPSLVGFAQQPQAPLSHNSALGLKGFGAFEEEDNRARPVVVDQGFPQAPVSAPLPPVVAHTDASPALEPKPASIDDLIHKSFAGAFSLGGPSEPKSLMPKPTGPPLSAPRVAAKTSSTNVNWDNFRSLLQTTTTTTATTTTTTPPTTTGTTTLIPASTSTPHSKPVVVVEEPSFTAFSEPEFTSFDVDAPAFGEFAGASPFPVAEKTTTKKDIAALPLAVPPVVEQRAPDVVEFADFASASPNFQAFTAFDATPPALAPPPPPKEAAIDVKTTPLAVLPPPVEFQAFTQAQSTSGDKIAKDSGASRGSSEFSAFLATPVIVPAKKPAEASKTPAAGLLPPPPANKSPMISRTAASLPSPSLKNEEQAVAAVAAPAPAPLIQVAKTDAPIAVVVPLLSPESARDMLIASFRLEDAARLSAHLNAGAELPRLRASYETAKAADDLDLALQLRGQIKQAEAGQLDAATLATLVANAHVVPEAPPSVVTLAAQLRRGLGEDVAQGFEREYGVDVLRSIARTDVIKAARLLGEAEKAYLSLSSAAGGGGGAPPQSQEVLTMWTKVIECSIVEMEGLYALLSGGAVTDTVFQSFLKHQKTQLHLKALSRVYKVAMRCLASMRKATTNSAEVRKLETNLQLAWERLTKRGVPIDRAPTNYSEEEPRCGVCFTHIRPTHEVAHLESARGGADCHLPCANFHVNRVSPTIP